jgi:ArsR family transcriptional regulator
VDQLACCQPLADAPLSAEGAHQLAGVLKALADPARLRLLSLIQAREGAEACVCHLTEPLGLTQPTVSHHLKVLHEAGCWPASAAGCGSTTGSCPTPYRPSLASSPSPARRPRHERPYSAKPGSA